MCWGLKNRLNPCGGAQPLTSRPHSAPDLLRALPERIAPHITHARCWRSSPERRPPASSRTASRGGCQFCARRAWGGLLADRIAHMAPWRVPTHNRMAPHVRATPVRAAAARQPQPRRSATAGRAPDAQRDGGPAHEPPLARHWRPHRPVLAAALALGPRGPHLALPLAPSKWWPRSSASRSVLRKLHQLRRRPYTRPQRVIMCCPSAGDQLLALPEYRSAVRTAPRQHTTGPTRLHGHGSTIMVRWCGA